MRSTIFRTALCLLSSTIVSMTATLESRAQADVSENAPTGNVTIVDAFETPQISASDADGLPTGWLVVNDPASHVGLEQGSPPSRVPGDLGATGNQALAITFKIDAWGAVVHLFTNATGNEWLTQDWSAYEGVGFWMYGHNTGGTVFFDLVDNRSPGSSKDDAGRYSMEFADNFEGWRFVRLPFASFKRKDIGNGAPDDGLTLTSVHGYAIGSLRADTVYYFDDVMLYGTAGEKPLTVGLSRADVRVEEGSEAALGIRLSRVSQEPVTVEYATGADPFGPKATPGRDYEAASGTLTIPAGALEASFSIATLDDDKTEPNETFQVTLSNPSGAELASSRSTLVTIEDNDPAPASLVEDFETMPAMFTASGAKIALREIGSGDRDVYDGQSARENVLDVDHEAGGRLSKDYALEKDWSAHKGIRFWFFGQGSGQKVDFDLTTSDAANWEDRSAWTEVWKDDFDGEAGTPPDPRNWSYEQGGRGWGNDELQYYTGDTANASLDGKGNLVITAREAGEGQEYTCWYGPCSHTSARLITEGKQEFAFGRVEIRAQLPRGGGIWPAFWALGSNFRNASWPQSGEIDIMEMVGRLPNEIFGTVHGPGYSGADGVSGKHPFDSSVPEKWQDFAVEWTPGAIDWFVDGSKYLTVKAQDVAPNDWVFDAPFYLLVNIAVGGTFGGRLAEDLHFPQQLVVDRIRVHQPARNRTSASASFVDDVKGWRRVELPFEAFADAAGKRGVVNAHSVAGYGFTFRGRGTASLDHLQLY